MVNIWLIYGHSMDNLWIWLVVDGVPTPLKNMKVNWEDDIPKIWENTSHVPKHQPVCRFHSYVTFHSISGIPRKVIAVSHFSTEVAADCRLDFLGNAGIRGTMKHQ